MFARILSRVPATTSEYRKPSVAGCSLGVLLMFPALIVGCLVLGLLFVPDYWVVPTLWMPDRLGLLQRTTEDQIATFFVTSSQPEFGVPHSGTYILLARGSFLGQPVLMSKRTGKRIALYNTNAINKYGVRNLDGVPVGEFTVDEPDTVQIANWRKQSPEMYALAPDFGGRNTRVIAWSFILQLAAIVLAVGGLYYGINRNRIRQEKAAGAEKRDRLGQWMQGKS